MKIIFIDCNLAVIAVGAKWRLSICCSYNCCCNCCCSIILVLANMEKVMEGMVEWPSCISLSARSLLLHLLRSLISTQQALATIQFLHLYFPLRHLVSFCIIDSNLFQTHQDICTYLSSDCK